MQPTSDKSFTQYKSRVIVDSTSPVHKSDQGIMFMFEKGVERSYATGEIEKIMECFANQDISGAKQLFDDLRNKVHGYDKALVFYSYSVICRRRNDDSVDTIQLLKDALDAVDEDIESDIVEIENLKFTIKLELGQNCHDLKVNKAIKYYEESIKINDKGILTYINYGKLLQSLDRYDEAIEKYNKAKELQPDCELPYVNLASLYVNLMENDEELNNDYVKQALTLCEKSLEINPNSYQALYYYAMAKFYGETIKDAIETMKECIKINSNNVQAHYWLGMFYLAESDYKLAKPSFERALQIEKTKKSSNLESVEYLSANFPGGCNSFKTILLINLGTAEYLSNEPPYGYDSFKAVLNQEPNNFAALLSISSSCIQSENFIDALDWTERIFEHYDNEDMDEKTCEILYRHIGLIMSALGFYEESCKAYKKAVKCSDATQKAENYFCLANVYYDMQKYEKSVEIYQLAISMSDNEALNQLIKENISDAENAQKNTREVGTEIPKKIVQNDMRKLHEVLKGHKKIIDDSNIPLKYTPTGAPEYASLRWDEDLTTYKKQGKLIHKSENGKWYTKSKLVTGNSCYDFIVLEEKGIFKIYIGTMGHYYLSKGKNVAYAGKISFNNGDVLVWSNLSGHYKPPHFEAPNISKLTELPLDKFSANFYLEEQLVRTLKNLSLKNANDNLTKVADELRTYKGLGYDYPQDANELINTKNPIANKGNAVINKTMKKWVKEVRMRSRPSTT